MVHFFKIDVYHFIRHKKRGRRNCCHDGKRVCCPLFTIYFMNCICAALFTREMISFSFIEEKKANMRCNLNSRTTCVRRLKRPCRGVYEHDLSIKVNKSRCFFSLDSTKRWRWNRWKKCDVRRKNFHFDIYFEQWIDAWHRILKLHFSSRIKLLITLRSEGLDRHRRHVSCPTHLGNYNCTTNLISSKVTFITFWKKTEKKENYCGDEVWDDRLWIDGVSSCILSLN